MKYHKLTEAGIKYFNRLNEYVRYLEELKRQGKLNQNDVKLLEGDFSYFINQYQVLLDLIENTLKEKGNER